MDACRALATLAAFIDRYQAAHDAAINNAISDLAQDIAAYLRKRHPAKPVVERIPPSEVQPTPEQPISKRGRSMHGGYNSQHMFTFADGSRLSSSSTSSSSSSMRTGAHGAQIDTSRLSSSSSSAAASTSSSSSSMSPLPVPRPSTSASSSSSTSERPRFLHGGVNTQDVNILAGTRAPTVTSKEPIPLHAMSPLRLGKAQGPARLEFSELCQRANQARQRRRSQNSFASTRRLAFSSKPNSEPIRGSNCDDIIDDYDDVDADDASNSPKTVTTTAPSSESDYDDIIDDYDDVFADDASKPDLVVRNAPARQKIWTVAQHQPQSSTPSAPLFTGTPGCSSSSMLSALPYAHTGGCCSCCPLTTTAAQCACGLSGMNSGHLGEYLRTFNPLHLEQALPLSTITPFDATFNETSLKCLLIGLLAPFKQIVTVNSEPLAVPNDPEHSPRADLEIIHTMYPKRQIYELKLWMPHQIEGWERPDSKDDFFLATHFWPIDKKRTIFQQLKLKTIADLFALKVQQGKPKKPSYQLIQNLFSDARQQNEQYIPLYCQSRGIHERYIESVIVAGVWSFGLPWSITNF